MEDKPYIQRRVQLSYQVELPSGAKVELEFILKEDDAPLPEGFRELPTEFCPGGVIAWRLTF
jgi:hypothetical protein